MPDIESSEFKYNIKDQKLELMIKDSEIRVYNLVLKLINNLKIKL